MCINKGDVHQFIGQCLIPLDPVYGHNRSRLCKVKFFVHLTDFCQKEFQMDVIYVSFITNVISIINIIFTSFSCFNN